MEGTRRSPVSVLVIALAWVVVMFLFAPMLVTLPMSLTPERIMAMPDGALSFRHYETLVRDPIWLGAIRDSLIVGFGATGVALTVGAAAATGLWQLGPKAARGFGALPLLPLIVPSVVSGLVLSQAAIWLGILDTYVAAIGSHAILGIPFVFMTVSAALEGVDQRMVQAARSLGAGPLRAIWQVVLPNIRPGLMTGAVFAFFTSWDEIVVTLFVTSRSVFTLPRKIWSDLRENIDPAVAAISALMICATLLVAFIYLVVTTLKARVKVAQ